MSKHKSIHVLCAQSNLYFIIPANHIIKTKYFCVGCLYNVQVKIQYDCLVLFRWQHQASVDYAVSSLIASLFRGRAPKGLFVKFNGRAINLDTQSQAGSQDGVFFFFTLFVLQMRTHLLQHCMSGLNNKPYNLHYTKKIDKHQRKENDMALSFPENSCILFNV